MDWECGDSGSDEWLEWTDIDGDDESYTESGPDVVLSIIKSWNICVAINCPLNAAGDVEGSFLLYPDEFNDEDTKAREEPFFWLGGDVLLCDLRDPK